MLRCCYPWNQFMALWIPGRITGKLELLLFQTIWTLMRCFIFRSNLFKRQGERFTTHLSSVKGYTSEPPVGYAIWDDGYADSAWGYAELLVEYSAESGIDICCEEDKSAGGATVVAGGRAGSCRDKLPGGVGGKLFIIGMNGPVWVLPLS